MQFLDVAEEFSTSDLTTLSMPRVLNYQDQVSLISNHSGCAGCEQRVLKRVDGLRKRTQIRAVQHLLTGRVTG